MNKSADRVTLKATVSTRAEAPALLQNPGDAVLIHRQRPRWLLLLCPDGCGETIPINLDERTGPAWSYYKNRRGISLYPSVWRESGCRSHFVVWNSRIVLFGKYLDDWLDEDAQTTIDERVSQSLGVGISRHYREIASALGEIPWTVLAACRRLVRLDRAEAVDDDGHFQGK
jgi:hypothetical protein